MTGLRLRAATREEAAMSWGLTGNGYLGPDGWLVPVGPARLLRSVALKPAHRAKGRRR